MLLGNNLVLLFSCVSLLFTRKTFIFVRLEKYRPKVLSDIVGNDDIVARMKIISRDGNMPNILLVVSLVFLNGEFSQALSLYM